MEYTNKRLADCFNQLTGIVVDSNNCIFEKTVIINEENFRSYASFALYRSDLKIAVIRTIYGTGNIDAVVFFDGSNTPFIGHVKGDTANPGVCLGLDSCPANMSLEIDIYSFK